MLMEPTTLIGTVIGVYLNVISPAYIILICLLLLLSWTSYETLKKVPSSLLSHFILSHFIFTSSIPSPSSPSPSPTSINHDSIIIISSFINHITFIIIIIVIIIIIINQSINQSISYFIK
jgi:hypothetical protein